MTEFEGVVPALGRALSQRGYRDLTPVQTAVLAPELAGADMLVSAQTGSGKTVAFGLALAPTLLAGAERFARAPAPLALAVAPTRELALQVKRELEWLFELTGASIATCVGGMDMRTERRALQQGAHIVVGTPGRLRDHIDRGSLITTELKAVVLDEADEMLDLGFRDDLEYILDAAPGERRTLMFSATVPRSIANLAKRYQRDAVRITTQAEQSQHVDIDYRALTVAPNDRENAIVNVLRFFEAKNALVFCSTRATVNHMTARFANRGFAVVALSGELNQNERTHALQAMRDGRARVCVATDVAARGIDLPNLELVVHADLPNNGDTLLHRSGRTGRAGRKGVSVLIVPHSQRRRAERLLQGAKIAATWEKPPSADDVNQRDDERLLADPALGEPLGEDEKALVYELLAAHGAEQVAAAFVRLYRAGRSAPEELLDIAVPERGREPARAKRRDDFANGVWFSLTVGRQHKAEARWLLPMLCRAGQITKHDIGAIRIHQSETHVELEPGSVDRFLEAIGPNRTVEKSIIVTRLEGVPDGPAVGREERDGRPPHAKPAQARPRGGDRPDFKSKKREARGAGREQDSTSPGGPGPREKTAKRFKEQPERPNLSGFDDIAPGRGGDSPSGSGTDESAPVAEGRERHWLKRKPEPAGKQAGVGKPKRSHDPSAREATAPNAPDDAPGRKPAKKPKARKPKSGKPLGTGLTSPNARFKSSDRPGSAPLKRKKAKKKPAN